MGAKKKSSGGDKLTASTTKCSPTLLQVARQHAELKQAVQLAAAGYNMFAVDGGKPFTVLVPSDAAVQELAAGGPAGRRLVGCGGEPPPQLPPQLRPGHLRQLCIHPAAFLAAAAARLPVYHHCAQLRGNAWRAAHRGTGALLHMQGLLRLTS